MIDLPWSLVSPNLPMLLLVPPSIMVSPTALCKRDVGAGGQNFKKAIFHTFFYRI